MSNTMKKTSYSKNILKLLAQKKAVAIPELVERISPQNIEKQSNYAIYRALKTLQDTGFLEKNFSGQQEYVRLTESGKKKLHSINLDTATALVDPTWDGKWRIIMLDISDDRKAERESLRYLLKKADFVCLKNSVWISKQPFEHLFSNIKKDLGLTTEILIIVTDTVDQETETAFMSALMV